MKQKQLIKNSTLLVDYINDDRYNGNRTRTAKTFNELYYGNKTRIAKTFNEVYFEKYNPYHDELGRFASSGSFSGLGRQILSQLGQGTGKNGFVNANSLSEAAKYAKQNLGFAKVIWNGLSLESANFINEHITNVQAKFPETKGVVSTLKVINDASDRALHAYIDTYKNGSMKLGINKHLLNDIDQFRQTCEILYEEGLLSSGSAEGTIWHEYGHVMASIQLKRSMGYRPKDLIEDADEKEVFMSKRKSKEYENEVISMAAYNLNSNSLQMGRQISEYAKTNLGEAFAEAFSDVYTNSIPTRESLAIIQESGLLR